MIIGVVVIGDISIQSDKHRYGSLFEKRNSTSEILDNKCPVSSVDVQENSREMLEIIFESSDYESKRNELGITHLTSQDIKLLTDANYIAACDQLNAITTVNGVDNMMQEWHKLYYKAGSYYFVTYKSKKPMLGFSPIYMFDQNFELKASWAL